jgi:competence protein ComFC
MLFLNLLFPKYCLGCGQEGRYFCLNCQKEIEPLKFQICPVCQQLSFNGLTHHACCNKNNLDGLIVFFPYQGILKKAIGKLKYYFITSLIEELSELILKVALRQLNSQSSFLKNKVILLPVPLYKKRQNWRGFNQAELLAKNLSRNFNWEVRTDFLIRSKSTPPQVGLKGKERETNLKEVFVFNHKIKMADFLKVKIILFDDVWTTGSTLKEAARVLKKAGFKKVFGLTICR